MNARTTPIAPEIEDHAFPLKIGHCDGRAILPSGHADQFRRGHSLQEREPLGGQVDRFDGEFALSWFDRDLLLYAVNIRAIRVNCEVSWRYEKMKCLLVGRTAKSTALAQIQTNVRPTDPTIQPCKLTARQPS